MYERILAPTDGSDGARRAVERAIELATLFNADLHLLYVVDTEQFSADKPEEAIEEMLAGIEAEGLRIVADLEASARESALQEVETAVRRGVASEQILGYAADADVELVVMSTHGEGGYETAHLGSVATDVARRIERPLLLV